MRRKPSWPCDSRAVSAQLAIFVDAAGASFTDCRVNAGESTGAATGATARCSARRSGYCGRRKQTQRKKLSTIATGKLSVRFSFAICAHQCALQKRCGHTFRLLRRSEPGAKRSQQLTTFILKTSTTRRFSARSASKPLLLTFSELCELDNEP